MRITPVNNQTFTAFRLKGDGAEKLAKDFIKNPDYEKKFMRLIVKPLSDSSSNVVYDGEKVSVKNNIFGKRIVTGHTEKEHKWGSINSIFEVFARYPHRKTPVAEEYCISDGGKSFRRVLTNHEKYLIPPEFLAAKEIALYEDKLIADILKQSISQSGKYSEAVKNKTKILKSVFGTK